MRGNPAFEPLKPIVVYISDAKFVTRRLRLSGTWAIGESAVLDLFRAILNTRRTGCVRC